MTESCPQWDSNPRPLAWEAVVLSSRPRDMLQTSGHCRAFQSYKISIDLQIDQCRYFRAVCNNTDVI